MVELKPVSRSPFPLCRSRRTPVPRPGLPLDRSGVSSGGVKLRQFKALALVAIVFVCSNPTWAQSSGKTVRRHRVAEAPGIAAGVAQAEAAIEKRDYAAAERLLKQAVAEHADDYRAWFDLGFVLNALGRKDDAIAAYRKSVAANPKVFESNLNL